MEVAISEIRLVALVCIYLLWSCICIGSFIWYATRLCILEQLADHVILCTV